MDNQLTIDTKNLLAAATQKEIGELIKPLSHEILLFDTYVAGTSYLDDDTVLGEVKEGDKLILQREDNKFDDLAILVLDDKKRKLGYIPEKVNIVFARLMDAGKLLTARINHIEPKGSFRLINISIYLVDF